MKVWPNRLPVEMIEAWQARAEAEGVAGSVLLRQVMREALARPGRIMPPEPAPEDCHHPSTTTVGYSRICCECRRAVP